MRWRLRREQFEEQKGERNRRALESGVAQGKITGIVGYLDGQPAAWCSVGPRDCFPGLAESDLLAPIDDQPVWSITCLFVARAFRRAGLGDRLLVAAVEYAAQQGAKIIEGYPLAPGDQKMPLAAAWTGFESVFKRGGFVEKARRVPMRPIYRFDANTHIESE
jgi:GNAT superfamily N-acetyltransferase